MVTRKLIRVTSPEAAAALAAPTESSSSSAAAPTSTKKSTDGNTNKNGEEKKRALPSEDIIRGREVKKLQRMDRFVMDLGDVPPQPPILKSKGKMKEGASSKYTGVTFDKKANKWHAQIQIDGMTRYVGSYENEEEAAIDYARAVFKYKGQEALNKKRERTPSAPSIDLNNVPPQLPIPKSEGLIKEGASKYTGVSFDKRKNKWQATITIDGKKRRIGYYVSEEEAAIDYARAVFKFKGEEALAKARKQNSSRSGPAFNIDLSDVPPQLPILKSDGRIKVGASKYAGISLNKSKKKWQAQIDLDGKRRYIGCYENEEEAATDYAKAVFKYKGQGGLDKKRERTNQSVNLSDVPPKQPILKSEGRIKEGASKYAGVSLIKATSKWQAQITIEGKDRYIGCYENEEEAAIDYARAVFKYKGENALVKARELTLSVPAIVIDLSDVQPQLPIPKSAGHIKEGSSKYTGVYFHKASKKWQAQILIEGKSHHIGCYENEEEAAVDYARAVFKYKGENASIATTNGKDYQNGGGRKRALPSEGTMISGKEMKKRQRTDRFVLDLSDVPPQQPIPKIKGRIKEGASDYTGVCFCKAKNKWKAQIKIEGKSRHIGFYENEEEAAVDFARAVFKYQGRDTLGTTEQKSD